MSAQPDTSADPLRRLAQLGREDGLRAALLIAEQARARGRDLAHVIRSIRAAVEREREGL